MGNFDAQQWAEAIRGASNPMVVAGEGCTEISLDGKDLIQTVVDLAEKLGCPVAATGNILPVLKERNHTVNAKKMWLAELFRYLEDEWEEPLLAERPDLLLLIGYAPGRVQGMAAGTKQIDTVHLGPGELPAARLSMGNIPLTEWKKNLEALVQAL